MEPPGQIFSRSDSPRHRAATLGSAPLIPLAGEADRPLRRPPLTQEHHPGSDYIQVRVDSFRRSHSDVASPFAGDGVVCHPMARNLARGATHLHEVVPLNLTLKGTL